VGLEKADPAFRASVQAIEKHLEAQRSHSAFLSENARFAAASGSWSSAETPGDEILPADHNARALFEAELAAAGAAVERFSHPAEPEAAVCLPSPTVPVPEAESAMGLPFPPTLDRSDPTVAFTAAPVESAVTPVGAISEAESPLIAEAPEPLPVPPLPAPFVEAARHVSSPATSLSATPDLVATESDLDSGAEENINTFAFSEPLPFATHTIVEPIAESSEAESTAAIEEPASAPEFEVHETLEALPQIAEVAEEQALPQAVEPIVESLPEPRPDGLASAPAFAVPASESPSAAGSNAPWWLSEIRRHRDPNRPPVLWKPARITLNELPDEGPESLPTEPIFRAETPHPWSTPQQAWESVSIGDNRLRSEAASQRSHTAEHGELSPNLSSRLSGLRNLLSVLGVKNGQAEDAGRQGSDGSNFDSRTDRPGFDQASLVDRDEIPPVSIGGASPRLVTAPPEFLPPKPIAINAGRSDFHLGESHSRQDRRPAYDEVDILPSKRGQYKKT